MYSINSADIPKQVKGLRKLFKRRGPGNRNRLKEDPEPTELDRAAAMQNLALLDYIPHLIYGRNPEGRYTIVNRSFADFASLDPLEIIGKTDEEINIFLNPDQIRATDELLFSSGQKKFIPIEPFTDRHGNLFWFQTVKTPLFNSQGQVSEIIIVSTDVTKKVETEQLLRKSELRYRSIFENNYSGIIVVDKELLILNHNKAFDSLVNELGHNYAVKDLKLYLDERDRRELLDLLNGLSTRNYEFFDIDIQLTAQDGQIRNTICFVRGLYDELQNFTEAVVTFQDITEEKKQQQKLEESELRFRTLVEHATEALLLLDLETGRYIEANHSASELFGYNREELLELKLGDLSPHMQQTQESLRMATNYMERARSGEPVVYEWEVQTKDGKRVFCEVRLIRMPYPDRTIIRTSVIDISERKKAEDLLNQEKIKLQESNTELINLNFKLGNQTKQLQEFAYIASHNLRAPAGNIRALLDFYHSERTEENLEILLEKLDIVAEDLMDTINDLAEVVKIKNEVTKDSNKIDLNKVIEKALDSLSQTIKELDAQVDVDLDGVKTIYAAKTYIESMFLNLLSNALKYSSPDRRPEIQISAIHMDNKVLFSIKDNGLGIDLERFGHKIFGLRKTFHRNKDSRGVGLFITKAQVEALGGEISIESAVDEGSTFVIVFPDSILKQAT